MTLPTMKNAVAYCAEVSIQRAVDVFLLNMSCEQLFGSTAPGHARNSQPIHSICSRWMKAIRIQGTMSVKDWYILNANVRYSSHIHSLKLDRARFVKVIVYRTEGPFRMISGNTIKTNNERR